MLIAPRPQLLQPQGLVVQMRSKVTEINDAFKEKERRLHDVRERLQKLRENQGLLQHREQLELAVVWASVREREEVGGRRGALGARRAWGVAPDVRRLDLAATLFTHHLSFSSPCPSPSQGLERLEEKLAEARGSKQGELVTQLRQAEETAAALEEDIARLVRTGLGGCCGAPALCSPPAACCLCGRLCTRPARAATDPGAAPESQCAGPAAECAKSLPTPRARRGGSRSRPTSTRPPRWRRCRRTRRS